MDGHRSNIDKILGLAVALLILVSALALWHIREAWLSLYPLLGGPKPALPLPTSLALQLSAPLPLVMLSIPVFLLVVVSGFKYNFRLLLVTCLGWFAFFLFQNWALALPFIPVEIFL